MPLQLDLFTMLRLPREISNLFQVFLDKKFSFIQNRVNDGGEQVLLALGLRTRDSAPEGLGPREA